MPDRAERARLLQSSGGERVYIRTNRGLWRPDGCGYTSDPAQAGTWPREEAERTTAHLGPEKCLKLIPVPSTPAEPNPPGSGGPFAWAWQDQNGDWFFTKYKDNADKWAREDNVTMLPLYAAPLPSPSEGAGEWQDGQHELLPFLALWAGQYQRDSGLDGIHPIHHALLAKYGAPMENFPLATNLPAPPLPLTDAGG